MDCSRRLVGMGIDKLRPMKFRGVFNTLLVCSSIGVSSCSEVEPKGLNRDSDFEMNQSLLNSTPVKATSKASQAYEKAIVGITMHDRSGKRLSSCTGTLISSNTVITAGHCFDAEFVLGFDHALIHFNHNIKDENIENSGLSVGKIRKIIFHPKYNTEPYIDYIEQNVDGKLQKVERRWRSYDHDIAIGTLEQTAPPGIKPAQLYEGKLESYEGVKLKVYGFGRAVDYTDSRHSPRAALLHTLQSGQLVLKNLVKDGRLQTQENSPSSVCNGDSGGPSFLTHKNQEAKLFAVTSASMGHIVGSGVQFRLCRGSSLVTPIAECLDWIKEIIKMEGAEL